MRAASRTHIGNVRASNQDALIVVPGKYGLYGVADGMGGHKAGDVASQMAVRVLSQELEKKKPSEALLRSGIEKANLMIYEEQKRNPDFSGMGTTMTVIWEDRDRVLLGHVGDSRAYRLRGKEIEQVSLDHSMVAEMVRDGVITAEEALRHPYRNIITRALGAEDTVNVDILEMERQPGDVFLICSDGLSEYVRDREMRDVLLRLSLEDAADELLRRALEGGGRDNVSLVIAEVTA